MKKAQKYIFIEYFIIKDGLMWQSILDILKEKVSQGVEVRVIYDDIECFFPKNEVDERIESDGFVQPYSDSPVDNENVGEHVYLQIINNAKDYVYICTPYLFPMTR